MHDHRTLDVPHLLPQLLHPLFQILDLVILRRRQPRLLSLLLCHPAKDFPTNTLRSAASLANRNHS